MTLTRTVTVTCGGPGNGLSSSLRARPAGRGAPTGTDSDSSQRQCEWAGPQVTVTRKLTEHLILEAARRGLPRQCQPECRFCGTTPGASLSAGEPPAGPPRAGSDFKLPKVAIPGGPPARGRPPTGSLRLPLSLSLSAIARTHPGRFRTRPGQSPPPASQCARTRARTSGFPFASESM